MIKRIEFYDYVIYALDGRPHHPSQPAIEYTNGMQSWYLFNNRHRYYGPQNSKSNLWYLHGELIK